MPASLRSSAMMILMQQHGGTHGTCQGTGSWGISGAIRACPPVGLLSPATKRISWWSWWLAVRSPPGVLSLSGPSTPRRPFTRYRHATGGSLHLQRQPSRLRTSGWRYWPIQTPTPTRRRLRSLTQTIRHKKDRTGAGSRPERSSRPRPKCWTSRPSSRT